MTGPDLKARAQQWMERARRFPSLDEADEIIGDLLACLDATEEQGWQPLLEAAKGVIAQFEAIKAHQDRLLVHGQTFESAARNWDEATMGQFIDFQALIDAVAAFQPPGPSARPAP